MSSHDDLVWFHARLCQTGLPEELFGPLDGDDPQRALNKHYRSFVARYHPDTHRGNPLQHHYAAEITVLLNLLYERAKERLEQGIYGHAAAPARAAGRGEIRTERRVYRVIDQLAEGDYADIFVGEFDLPSGGVERVSIKVIRSGDDDAAARNERRILQRLKHKSLPVLLDAFTTSEGRQGTVLRHIDGVDLRALRERYPGGLAPEHACWVLERLLSVLGFLHANRVIHGNIEPGNVLVRPRDHNALLIDLLFSVDHPGPGDRFQVATEPYTAPEVYQKKPPIPPSDLFSLGKCMVFLLGGDAASGRMPGVDRRLGAFVDQMLDPHPLRRARDAWQLWQKLSDLRLEMFGQRHQFLPLDL